MPKFGDYSAATTLADSDVTVFSTSAGTKKITIANIANKIKRDTGIASQTPFMPNHIGNVNKHSGRAKKASP